jgi:hypothetical protein
MLRIALSLLAVAVTSTAFEASARGGGSRSYGSHSVRPYVTKGGTYVAPHYRTNPNATRLDNWSTKGNVNPYTAAPGRK